MPSPYPWHYTIRWPFYFRFPSMKNRTKIKLMPDFKQYRLPESNSTKLLFCGDIMVHNGDRIPTLHPKLCELIHSADLFIGNCESPIGNQPLNPNIRYRFNFHMPKTYLESIINQTGLPTPNWILSIANNHSGDKGYQACLDSFKIMDKMGITQLGRYQPNSFPVQIREINNIRIGFLGWTNWMNCEVFPKHDPGVYRLEHILKHDWKKIKKENKIDFLIAIPHWEYEFQHFPHQSSRELAQKLINNIGIDFIVGIHPHSLQPMEEFENGLCFYSLGNFYGLGKAWSVKLITLLELVLNSNESGKNLISSYKLHYFFQYENGEDRAIIPLEKVSESKRQKILNRAKKIFD